MIAINIASEFSRFPGGRYKRFGEYSGEEFRDRILIPALDRSSDNEIIEVDLTDVFTVPPSFLDEAFAGLIRSNKLTYEEFSRKFRFKADEVNRPYLHLIKEYVKEASTSMQAA